MVTDFGGLVGAENRLISQRIFIEPEIRVGAGADLRPLLAVSVPRKPDPAAR